MEILPLIFLITRVLFEIAHMQLVLQDVMPCPCWFLYMGQADARGLSEFLKSLPGASDQLKAQIIFTVLAPLTKPISI